MSHVKQPREHDRRGFLMLLVTAFTALPAAVHAQAPPATPPATPLAATPTPAAPAAPEHTTNEARLFTEVLRARYPDRFDEKQWGSISSDFDGDLSGGKRLRAMKLANGDEPDATFRP
jgi:hypothetical protein